MFAAIFALTFVAIAIAIRSGGSRELEAIQQLKAAGGQFSYPMRFDDETIALLGFWRDYFDHPTSLELDGTAFTDADLAMIRYLPMLERVCLKNGSYRPSTLSVLSELKELQILCLAGKNVTDEYLLYLPRLVGAAYLSIDYSSLSDGGLRTIGKCNWIESLSLRGSAVSDAGIGELKCLPDLQELRLDDTDVSDACLKQRIDFPALKQISLRRTKVTGDGVLRFLDAAPRIRAAWEPRKPAGEQASAGQ